MIDRSVRLFLFVFFALFVTAVALSQQATATAPATATTATIENELRAQLIGKVLWMRHSYDSSSISFNSDGTVVGSPKPRSFTLSGLKVTKIHLSESSLQIEGDRVGMIFPLQQTQVGQTPSVAGKEKFSLVNIPGHVKIQIARNPIDAAGLSKAFREVFTGNFSGDSIADLPECWKWYFGLKAAVEKTQDNPQNSTVAPPAIDHGASRVGGGVIHPQVTHSVDPVFTEEARQLHYSGIVVLNMIVDAAGKPTRIRILRPLGLGLDENAVRAVEQYSFRPALYKGLPVPVEVSIELNYGLYR